MIRRWISAAAYALALTMIWNGPAYSASGSAVLTVESVLSPAWVERANGRREPLVIGMGVSEQGESAYR